MESNEPENMKESSVELGEKLSDVVLEAPNIDLLVEAIKMMSEDTRESLKRAIEMAER